MRQFPPTILALHGDTFPSPPNNQFRTRENSAKSLGGRSWLPAGGIARATTDRQMTRPKHGVFLAEGPSEEIVFREAGATLTAGGRCLWGFGFGVLPPGVTHPSREASPRRERARGVELDGMGSSVNGRRQRRSCRGAQRPSLPHPEKPTSTLRNSAPEGPCQRLPLCRAGDMMWVAAPRDGCPKSFR